MKKKSYRPRLIDGMLEKYLNSFGAVYIEGPKWCGKTWACEQQAVSEYKLGDPAGNFQNLKLAQIDVNAAISGDCPHLIDEWQEIPELWDAVRYAVDDLGGKPGCFILTGSSAPKRKGILHSGAGRIARLRMHSMSLYESGDSSGTISLRELFQKTPEMKMTGDMTLARISDLIINGGWPARFALSKDACGSVLAEQYVQALIQEDVLRLEDKKRDVHKMELLMRSLARNESTTVSVRTIKNDMRNTDGSALDDETIADYLDALKRLYVIENQKPFSPNVRSSVRVKQAEKTHFTDPSIACALLNLKADSLIGDLQTFGFMFEALCERDLKIYANADGGNLYHYQDYKGREIDAVVEMNDGKWGAFEIKLGANQIDAAAESLLKIKKEFEEDKNANPPDLLCVVCGMSKAAYTRPDGVAVVPITALKN